MTRTEGLGTQGQALGLSREEIAQTLSDHFKSVVEATSGLLFAETDVTLPIKSFEGYADALIARAPSPDPALPLLKEALEEEKRTSSQLLIAANIWQDRFEAAAKVAGGDRQPP
jgi:hypothetical protein